MEKGSKKKGKRKEPSPKRMVAVMEGLYDGLRELYRPLVEEEKAKLEKLLEEGLKCEPEDEDAFAIMRLLSSLDMFDIEVEELTQEEILRLAFTFGMAYERLRSKA